MQTSIKLISLSDIINIPAGSVWTLEAFMEYPAESSTPAFGRLVTHLDGASVIINIEGKTASEVEAKILKSFCPCIAY